MTRFNVSYATESDFFVNYVRNFFINEMQSVNGINFDVFEQ